MYVVTGGAGFIGSNIVKGLNERGITDILVVDDLSDGERFKNLCDLRISDFMDRAEFRRSLNDGSLKGRITAISHQGACSDTMERDGRYMMDNNFTYSKDVLHAAYKDKIPLVYASSAAVYGNSRTFKEESAYEQPLNVYGYSKLAFDQHVRRVIPQAHSTIVGLRYFNVYGPRERFKGRMASMVYQLYRQLKDKEVARLFEGTGGYANGDQQRDFVFAGDIVDINVHFLESEKPVTGVFNVGTGTSRSFNDVARTLIHRIGAGRIEYFPFPKELESKYQHFTKGDISKLREAGYHAAATPIEVGITKCVEVWGRETDS